MSKSQTGPLRSGLRRARAAIASTPSAGRLPDLGPAADFDGVFPWINTPNGAPLALPDLQGRVVLLEFWAFACGNCQRTLPFLKEMHARYRPQGFTVVAIHTPELPLERPPRNVERVRHENGLTFPIGVDNDFVAWDAYDNHYWPSQYLIDSRGHVRYTHIGEGRYGRTEAAIVALLAER